MDPVTPSDNPFTPSFGSLPPFLAGRDELLREIQLALATGPKHPGFTSLILGPRGTGKTTALLRARDDAQAAGWVICKVEALLPGADVPLHEAIMDKAQDQIDDIAPKTRRELTQIGIAPFSASWDTPASRERGSRRMERALDALTDMVVDQGGAGVLVIVDEFHNVRAQDASVIASAFQQLAKDQGKPVAFLGAGLTHLEHTLLPNKGFTFFQRCKRHRLEKLEILEAKQALRIPLENRVHINDHFLCRAAGATHGHPYSVQSLGFHLWNAIETDSAVEEPHLFEAIERMKHDLRENIITPIWRTLSTMKRAFLAAMSEDSGMSLMSSIIERMQTTPAIANTYRQRLIDEGIIMAAGHGVIDFIDDRIRELAEEHQAELTARRIAGQDQPGHHDESDETQQGSKFKKPRCGAMLPVAQRPCIRPHGHAGPHRST